MHIFPSLNFQAGYCSKSSFCAVCYISAQTKSFRQDDLKLLLQEPNTNRDTEKKFQVVPTTRAAAIKENRAASFIRGHCTTLQGTQYIRLRLQVASLFS